MGIFPQQRHTEGVHGFDIGPVDPQELPAEVGVSGVGGHTEGQLSGDFPPKFSGGGTGIGDNQEVVDIPPFHGDVTEEAFHQHLGFPGPGGGRDQQRSAPVLHGGHLLPQ